MSRFMTNSDVIALFEGIDKMKENAIISEEQLKKEVASIHNKIIEGLSFLVYNNVKQYRKFSNYEDLVQEGFIGLIRAVRRFNHKLFPNFFVYAEKWIAHSIKRAASRFDVVYCPNKNRVIYSDSLEMPTEKASDENPEDIFFDKEKKKKIEKILDDFQPRDKEIIKRIYGLGEYDSPQTLREIGPMYDLTHERIRQIKNKVILKLRKNENLIDLY